MKNIKNNFKSTLLTLMVLGLLFASCNKDVQQYDTTVIPPVTGLRLASRIESNPTDSMYYRLIVKAGLVNFLNDSTKKFTMFITDNPGMKIAINRLSGGLITLAAADSNFYNFINNNIPQASAAGIVIYNTVGQIVPSSLFPSTFPNSALPSQIQLDAVNFPFVRARLSIVKGTPYTYLNNIPLVGQQDLIASNGLIHHALTLIAPPSPPVPAPVLKNLIAAEPTLSYFRAAVARADSGSVGTARFDSLFNFGLTNMTVLAPSDAAFQTLIYGLAYSSYLRTRVLPYTATDSAIANATGNGAVAAGPAFLNTNNVSTALIRGVIAYHILATDTGSKCTPNIRVFSVNVPTTPTFLNTLVNGAPFPNTLHAGVRAVATFASYFTSSVTFTGFRFNGTTFIPSGPAANVIAADKFAVNGVFHIIDRVLLPALP
jgi:hypothetical protein